MKILKKLFSKLKIRLMTEEEFNAQIDNILTEFRRAHPNEPIPDNILKNLGNSYQLEIKNTMMPLNNREKYKNMIVKEIINSAFNYMPSSELTLQELALLQNAAREKYISDPIWKGAVDSFVDYVIGTGTKVSTPIPELTDILNKFRKDSDFGIREASMVKSIFLDGEYFAILFFDRFRKTAFLRKGHPQTITDIETNPEDVETVYCYKREFATVGQNGKPWGSSVIQYLKDIDYDRKKQLRIIPFNGSANQGKFHQNAVCLHIKMNETDQLRGIPPVTSILKYLKKYEDFINDRMTLIHEKSKVVWFKRILGRNEGQESYLAPRGGIMLKETNEVSYRTEKPNFESTEAKEDALNLLYYIGSAIRYPLHVLNQRTDQQVYASIRKADTPFSTMITGFQWFLALNMEKIYRTVLLNVVPDKAKKYSYPEYTEDAIMNAVEVINSMTDQGYGEEDIINKVQETLEKGKTMVSKTLEEIPISQDYPQVLWQDPKELAEVLKAHKEVGIASLSTLSTKAGYSWPREFAKIMLERKTMPSLEEKKFEQDSKIKEQEINKPKIK